MKLCDIEFGRVFNSSGARGFFGEGYRFHKYWKKLGLDYLGATFVAKTATLESRPGNMSLVGIRPKEFKPACIKVNFRKAAVLNAVGLSNPGLDFLLSDGRWQQRREPFFISFAAVDGTRCERSDKIQWFAKAINKERSNFRAPFGVQLNFSCPNTGTHFEDFENEVAWFLAICRKYMPNVPLVPKFNVLVPIKTAARIMALPECDAICISNSIPWGVLPFLIDWKGLFGKVSPLAHLGGGGLSGRPIHALVCDWIWQAYYREDEYREEFRKKPIIACGGIMSSDDAWALNSAGATAIELGTISIVRPWRVRGIIRELTADYSTTMFPK